ncbi:hypothetical protein ACE01N_19660 [Saccharicrinis sp. FJH2]|uniref:hypothetical protein n=1 Tax=Saccharicrinis sp. FJH65 TaxID=3344659 RepID=UPI0035F3986E
MGGLDLNFLDNSYSQSKTTLIDILHKYGTEICEYAKEYFSYTVATTELDGEVKTISLYILAPDIPYEYRILVIEVINISAVKITLFPLTGNPTDVSVNIINGLDVAESKIKEYLESKTASQSFHLLVSKINLKRKSDKNNSTQQ